MALLALIVLSGCTGTMMTRSNRPMENADSTPGSMFGGYPFQAVVVDYRIEERSINEGNSYVILGSLVIDLVIDAVLAPIDLIAWPFGCRKRSLVR